MQNPFNIENITPEELTITAFQMEVCYDGLKNEAKFATEIVDDHYRECIHLYPESETKLFMVYCSFIQEAIYACIHKGVKCNLYIDFNKDIIYCLPQGEA